MTRHSFARPGRGFAAVGIWHPKFDVNIGTLWRTARLYDVAFVFTVGHRYVPQASDTANTPAHVPLFHYVDIDDLIEHLPAACPLVGVEDHGLPPAVLDRCHRVVQIPTARPESMNVAVAGSIVLAHRHMAAAATRAVVA